MTRGQKLLAGFLVCLILAVPAVVGIVYGTHLWHGNKQGAQVRSATSSSGDSDTAGLKVAQSTGLGGGLPEPLAQRQTEGNAAAGTGDSKASSNNSATPGDLKDYEKYKTEKAALFADIKVGTGNEVAVNKKVAIYYKGQLTDGTVFDQSAAEKAGEQPKPLIFVVGEHTVVLGMEQGVVGMRGGGRRRIIIPPAVGYGERGFGPVPSNALMIFDVELIDVQ